jgi:uncharacterized protein (DUF1697 family)
MSQYIAFLRAINVGRGRTLKMKALRQPFEALGLSNVATFIASGNVIFETKTESVKALEKIIEKRLGEELGYELAAFIRTAPQLAKIANYKPFSPRKVNTASEFNIILLSDKLGKKLRQELMELGTDTNEFHIRGREIYWLRRKEKGKSAFSTIPFEKVLGKQFTTRSAKTLKRLALKISKTKSAKSLKP